MTKKQLLVMSLSLLFIMLLLGGVLVLSGLKKTATPAIEVFPTPTPISIDTTLPHTFVGSSFPPNNMTDIGTNTAISYTFPASLSAQEKNNVSLQISPATQGSLSWDQDTITFIPDSPLTTNQKYMVTLINGKSQNTWSFTTSPVATDPNNAAAEQQAGDVTFGKITQQNLTNYPWLSSLPIQSSQYFVYFNVQQKAFLATVYPNTKSTMSQQDQVASIKTAILQQLSHIGIQTSVYPFVWTVTPVSE